MSHCVPCWVWSVVGLGGGWLSRDSRCPSAFGYSSLVHLPPTTRLVPSGWSRQTRSQYGYLRQQSRSVVHDEPYQQSTQTCAERSQRLKRRQHSRSLEHMSRKHIRSGSRFQGNLSTGTAVCSFFITRRT